MDAQENPPADSAQSPVESAGGKPTGKSQTEQHAWAQVLVLAVVYSVPALMCTHIANITDSDIWWHMRTGEWIMQHHAVPRADPFSSSGAGKPWVAYSWLFELLTVWLFQHMGLAGLIAYTSGMMVAITAALHRLTRRMEMEFSMSMLLTFAGVFCLVRLWTPRPWLFTILFFILELDLILYARRTGKWKQLLWLPLLFAMWANLHIHFVIGLAVLAIAGGESMLARWQTGIQARLGFVRLCGIGVACVLGTLVNPYGWGLYRVVFEYVSQAGIYNKISEVMAMPFRSLDDYGVLVFTIAAACVLARARRMQVFESVLLAFAIYESFRAQREIWLVVITACAILASGIKANDAENIAVPRVVAPLAVIVAVLMLLAGFQLMPVRNNILLSRLGEKMPVKAVAFVKEKNLAGPLYNDLNWGGFLVWNLRMPPSIDGRTNVYGDAWVDRSWATWNGRRDWASDPDLSRAGLVIGPVSAPLTQLLRTSPHFELAYEDELAAVFVARSEASTAASGK